MVKLTEEMVISRTRISDLSSIRKLNCWGADLSDVSLLKQMPNVEVLALSVNQISSLADFQYCTRLQELYIRKNSIQDLREICHLRGLTCLRNLWLADNPCSEAESYRHTVLHTLPQLQKLDDIIVRPEEIQEAARVGRVLQPPEAVDESFNGTESLTESDLLATTTSPPRKVSESVVAPQKIVQATPISQVPTPQSPPPPEAHNHALTQLVHEGFAVQTSVQNDLPKRRFSTMTPGSIVQEKALTDSAPASRRSSLATPITSPVSEHNSSPSPHSTASIGTVSSTPTPLFEPVQPPRCPVHNQPTYATVSGSQEPYHADYGQLNGPLHTMVSSTSAPLQPVPSLPSTPAHQPDCYNSFPSNTERSYHYQEQQRPHRMVAELQSPRNSLSYTSPSYASQHPNHFVNLQRSQNQNNERFSPTRPAGRTRNRASNLLMAALCLVNELDYASLEVLSMAVRNRLDELED